MDPMYQAMMAQDPMAAQQEQMGYYRPNAPSPQPSLGGMGGMNLQQMMNMAQQGRDARINQVHDLSRDGGAAL